MYLTEALKHQLTEALAHCNGVNNNYQYILRDF